MSASRHDFVLDRPFDELVQADAFGSGRIHGTSVEIRIDARVELAGIVKKGTEELSV